MEEEIWKDIPEYEGLYQVSNYGRVKSLNYNRMGEERILKPFKNKFGYLLITLSKKNRQKHFRVHKLVALAFIPNDNPIEKIEVNHLDENKENNHVDNLCWCSHIENCNYCSRNERIGKSKKGQKRTNETKQKISKAKSIYIIQYTLDNEFVKEWDSATTASKELKINQGNITQCCKGERKTCGGFIWKYKENNTNLVIS